MYINYQGQRLHFLRLVPVCINYLGARSYFIPSMNYTWFPRVNKLQNQQSYTGFSENGCAMDIIYPHVLLEMTHD